MTASERPGPEATTEMSGLDFMRAMLEGDIPNPPMAETMNFALEAVEPGRTIFAGAPRAAHLNTRGHVHGGWYGTLLDNAMGCAALTYVPQGSTYTTMEFKVNICRAIPKEMRVRGIGEVVHGGRTTIVAQGEIRGVEDDRLYATASTTCLVITLSG